MRVNKPPMGEVRFSVHAEQDDLSDVEGSFDTGDARADREIVAEILESSRAGNVWAWAQVTVVAKWGEFEGASRLGHCSYDSKQEFMYDPTYFDSMKEEAYDELCRNIDFANFCAEGTRPAV